MRYTVATLLSAAAFPICTFARPPPPQPAAISTPLAKRYASGWASGWCGVHVTQFQKNEGPSRSDGGNQDYRLTVSLYDALQDSIGGETLLSAPGGSYEDIDSQLPNVFEVEVGANDQQPVRFAYNGQAWSSNDGQCSTGGFDSGSRNMDCGFNC